MFNCSNPFDSEDLVEVGTFSIGIERYNRIFRIILWFFVKLSMEIPINKNERSELTMIPLLRFPLLFIVTISSLWTIAAWIPKSVLYQVVHKLINAVRARIASNISLFLRISISSSSQADIMSVCAYFAFFFMCGYKFKQSRAVVNRIVSFLLSISNLITKLFDQCNRRFY